MEEGIPGYVSVDLISFYGVTTSQDEHGVILTDELTFTPNSQPSGKRSRRRWLREVVWGIRRRLAAWLLGTSPEYLEY